MCTRNIVQLTISTAVVVDEKRSVAGMILSEVDNDWLVLSTFRMRLLTLHEPTSYFTSFLYARSLSSLMRPTTIASSTNFRMWLVAAVGTVVCHESEQQGAQP